MKKHVFPFNIIKQTNVLTLESKIPNWKCLFSILQIQCFFRKKRRKKKIYEANLPFYRKIFLSCITYCKSPKIGNFYILQLNPKSWTNSREQNAKLKMPFFCFTKSMLLSGMKYEYQNFIWNIAVFSLGYHFSNFGFSKRLFSSLKCKKKSSTNTHLLRLLKRVQGYISTSASFSVANSTNAPICLKLLILI